MRRLAGLAGLLLVASVPASPAAGDGVTFGGYEAVAAGTAISAAPSVPALLPVETPFEATLSLTLATLSTGGQGFGRASTFFPGTLTAGLRPLLEVGAGVQLPIPDYPLVVETREYEDAEQSRLPGVTMRSDVDADRAEVISDTGGFIVPAVLDVGVVRTTSEVLLAAGTITSRARTILQGIDIVAGAVHIDAVESLAAAASDSAAGTCGGAVTVTGARVGPTPVTISESGVDGGPLVQQALAAAGVELRLLGGGEACETASASRTTSGVLVSVPLPAAGAIPPGGKLTFVLGAASATATASPPFDLRPVEPDAALPTPGNVVPRIPGPASGGVALPPASRPSATPPAATVGPGGALAPSSTPVAYSFDGVPTSLVAGGLLLAVPMARRIRRYMERLAALTT